MFGDIKGVKGADEGGVPVTGQRPDVSDLIADEEAAPVAKKIELESPDGDAKLEAAVVKSTEAKPSMTDDEIDAKVKEIQSMFDPSGLQKAIALLQSQIADMKPKGDDPGTATDNKATGPSDDLIPPATKDTP